VEEPGGGWYNAGHAEIDPTHHFIGHLHRFHGDQQPDPANSVYGVVMPFISKTC